VLRPLRLLPECLALELEKLGGAALPDHLAVALDFFRCVLGPGARGERGRRYKCKRLSATAGSVVFDSPWVSRPLSSVFSPFAPPFRRKENTGLREMA